MMENRDERGTHDLALILRLLRFKRRTRFFLHLALIFAGSRLQIGQYIVCETRYRRGQGQRTLCRG